MGYLIAIEGLDGSGKNTQSEKLKNYLESKGKKVVKISFPDYDSVGSSLVKMYLNGEMGDSPSAVNAYAASSFYACDRYISFIRNWKNIYEDPNTIIIANRYTTANAYHQLSKLPKEEWDEFLSWLWDYEYNKLGLPEPNLVVCFEVPADFSVKNIEKRCSEENVKKDIHEKDVQYLKDCYNAAHYVADKCSWKVIECVENGQLQSIDEIFGKLLDATGLKQ